MPGGFEGSRGLVGGSPAVRASASQPAELLSANGAGRKRSAPIHPHTQGCVRAATIHFSSILPSFQLEYPNSAICTRQLWSQVWVLFSSTRLSYDHHLEVDKSGGGRDVQTMLNAQCSHTGDLHEVRLEVIYWGSNRLNSHFTCPGPCCVPSNWWFFYLPSSLSCILIYSILHVHVGASTVSTCPHLGISHSSSLQIFVQRQRKYNCFIHFILISF